MDDENILLVLWKWCCREWAVIRGAPFSFVIFLAIGVVVVGYVIFVLIFAHYSGRVETLEIALRSLEVTSNAKIEFLELKLKNRPAPESSSKSAPYVFVKAGNVYNLKEGTLQGYVVAINTDEKNHATITDWQVGITVSATPPTGGLETFGRIERQEGAAIVPSRDGISAYRNYGILDGATYRAIISGKKRIYVFGKAKYNGVDGESHLTVFCYIFYGSETSHRHDGYDAPQAKYCEAPYNEAR